MGRKGNKEQKQVWLSRINDLVESGLTQQEWCNRNQIAISTLRYWIRKLRVEEENSNKPSFLKVSVAGPDNTSKSMSVNEASISQTINIKHGEFTVELPYGYGLEEIYGILSLLKQL